MRSIKYVFLCTIALMLFGHRGVRCTLNEMPKDAFINNIHAFDMDAIQCALDNKSALYGIGSVICKNTEMYDFFVALHQERLALQNRRFGLKSLAPEQLDHIRWNFAADLLTFQLLVNNLKERRTVAGRLFKTLARNVSVEVDKTQKSQLTKEVDSFLSNMLSDAIFDEYKKVIDSFLTKTRAQKTFGEQKTNEELLVKYQALHQEILGKYSEYKASQLAMAAVAPQSQTPPPLSPRPTSPKPVAEGAQPAIPTQPVIHVAKQNPFVTFLNTKIDELNKLAASKSPDYASDSQMFDVTMKILTDAKATAQSVATTSQADRQALIAAYNAAKKAAIAKYNTTHLTPKGTMPKGGVPSGSTPKGGLDDIAKRTAALESLQKQLAKNPDAFKIVNPPATTTLIKRVQAALKSVNKTTADKIIKLQKEVKVALATHKSAPGATPTGIKKPTIKKSLATGKLTLSQQIQEWKKELLLKPDGDAAKKSTLEQAFDKAIVISDANAVAAKAKKALTRQPLPLSTLQKMFDEYIKTVPVVVSVPVVPEKPEPSQSAALKPLPTPPVVKPVSKTPPALPKKIKNKESQPPVPVVTPTETIVEPVVDMQALQKSLRDLAESLQELNVTH